MMPETGFIEPDWPAPANVRALVTTRAGGSSEGGFTSNNLATHVGDDLKTVFDNRHRLAEQTGLSDDRFCWLNQVHGTLIVAAQPSDSRTEEASQADGCDSTEQDLACVVLTADCLPVLLCSLDGARVSAVHAGWRGLAGKILTQAIQRYPDPATVIAWLGPAIGPDCFEVGEEVYQAFVSQSEIAKQAFKKQSDTKWLADLYLLAKQELQAAGISGVYGGNFCTYSDAKRFYSYRRDGVHSGRIASLIWRQG